MLAHQGGWDELLLPFAVLLVVFGAPALLRRRRATLSDTSGGGMCAYCGAELRAGDRRCERCGFRAVSGQGS
jgi:predicted amidophosphoribosyltransferase